MDGCIEGCPADGDEAVIEGAYADGIVAGIDDGIEDVIEGWTVAHSPAR